MRRKKGGAIFQQSRLGLVLSLPPAVFAFYYALRYGLRGFHNAADIVFYGGWQVANGQLPYLDFFVSYGAVQYLIQGGLMKLFGPSWLVYCVHAALFNAAFVLLLFALLRRFALPLWMAFVYSWCAGIAYYPVMGYPQPDKHSFLFLLLALLLQLLPDRETPNRRVALLYAAAAFSYVAAFFCKANPTVLYPLAALGATLALGRRQWVPALAGAAAVLGFFLLAGLAVELARPGFLSNLSYYLVTLPGDIARERSGGSLPLLKMAEQARFSSITLSYAALAAGAGILVLRLGELGDGAFRRTVLLPLLLAFSFVVITIFHITHIGQPPLAHVTLIVPALALIHAAALNAIGDGGGERLAKLALSLLLLVFVAVDVSEYNRLSVKRRLSYDREMDLSAMQERGASGLAELADVEFVPIASEPDFLAVFAAVAAELKANGDQSLLLGFSPWHYAFAGKAPLLPAIYIMPGHSSPREDSPQETDLAKRLAANLERNGVKSLLVKPDRVDAAWQALDQAELACDMRLEAHVVRIDLCEPFKAESLETARALLRLAS